MNLSFDHILPSLEAFGLWSYWIIGFAALLEAIFVTGVFMPGTLVVDAGGILVQQGALDYFDLIWFVAIGSSIGGEVSYLLGRKARQRLSPRLDPESSPHYKRAKALFDRYGGFALVLGRFLGPVSGLVPLAASLSDMPRRKFLIWNLLSSISYAIAHVSFGYFVGDVAFSFGPLVTRVGLLVGAVVVLLFLLWWIAVRIIRLVPFVISVTKSVLTAIKDNADVRLWAQDHPKLARFLGRRFQPDTFFGLTATLLASAAAYIFVIWLGSVFDFLMLDPIVFADTRVANLVHAFWSPGFLRLSAFITGLGDWKVALPLLLAMTVATLTLRRPDLLFGLYAALGTDLVAVTLLKRIFHRTRPELGYFVETSGSFPSGHAALSVSFYGFLFFILWRMKVIRVLPAVIGAVTLAFFLGLSRIYLIEHYLSDVLNGWLVGAFCLLIGIAVAEWAREAQLFQERRMPFIHSGPVSFALVACLLMGALWQVAIYDKARNVAPAAVADVAITSVQDLVASARLPVQTESVMGTPLEPINVIILARDGTALVTALEKAHWIEAQTPSFAALTKAAFAAWSNQADDAAAVTPYFWHSAPNDIALQKPTPDATLRRRHHVRFWRSQYVTAEGLRVFVGAASFDDGLDWGLLHHIAPNIDEERDTLAADLTQAEEGVTAERLRVSQPRLGQSIAGDPWFSDGEAVILTLP